VPDPAPILAAGALLWRSTVRGEELAVIHRPRYDDWSLPKGKPAPGEHLILAAVREIAEETGLDVHLGRPLGTVSYETTEGPKRVHYWTAQAHGAEGTTFSPNAEVDALEWLAPDAARARLTHEHDVALLDRALQAPLDTHQVLLLRHANAGDRSDWRGPDELRPLDERGRAQARDLVPVLETFGPVAITSAPRVRCVETVEPLAEHLGLPIELDERLTDEAGVDDTEAAVALIREISLKATCAVLCSQGGAIPAIIGQLCHEDQVRPARRKLPSRKGSFWVLSLHDGRVVATDYVPSVLPGSW
jgi:8-oxo-dGTP pyrophosphatase MutT (NUDIX family)/phosphohistidine phosphatase SixA